jgi:hypothetical protein
MLQREFKEQGEPVAAMQQEKAVLFEEDAANLDF